jgi:hypothetical protein
MMNTGPKRTEFMLSMTFRGLDGELLLKQCWSRSNEPTSGEGWLSRLPGREAFSGRDSSRFPFQHHLIDKSEGRYRGEEHER